MHQGGRGIFARAAFGVAEINARRRKAERRLAANSLRCRARPMQGHAPPGASESDEIVRLVDVRRRFGTTPALDGISLTARRGEIVGIIGRSGAGKSTLIRCLNGLERADSGRDPYRRTRYRRLVGKRAAAAAPPHRHDLPAFQPAFGKDCRRQCRPAAEDRKAVAKAERLARAAASCSNSSVLLARQRPILRAALGRAEAARRHRPGAGSPPGPAPFRRGDLRPRSRDDRARSWRC